MLLEGKQLRIVLDNQRETLTLSVLALSGVFSYGYIFRGKTGNQKWEVEISESVEKKWNLRRKVKPVVKFGNLYPGLATTGALALATLPFNGKKWWVPPASFITTAFLVKIVGKPFFNHKLNGGLGYPSSHSAVTLSALVGYISVIPKGVKNREIYIAIPTAVACALPIAVYAGNHHRLSEIIAGAATGVSIAKIYATL